MIILTKIIFLLFIFMNTIILQVWKHGERRWSAYGKVHVVVNLDSKGLAMQLKVQQINI